MVKAVDGGGGRGIRLIRSENALISAVKRAVEESPSRQVFAEKAAVDGFRHIEVQIIGGGNGYVTHLWERECSIQRRYQKIVEIAPSVALNRQLITRIIEDAMRMAKEVSLSEDILEHVLTSNRLITSHWERSNSSAILNRKTTTFWKSIHVYKLNILSRKAYLQQTLSRPKYSSHKVHLSRHAVYPAYNVIPGHRHQAIRFNCVSQLRT